MGPTSTMKKFIPFKSWLRPLSALSKEVYPHTLTLPYCGARRFNTRIILHPEVYFTRAKYRISWNLLKRPVSIPVKIRLCSAPHRLVETVIEIVPGEPAVIDFRCILEDNGLPEEEDYTIEFPVETTELRPNIEFQMRDIDCSVWGSFVILWPSFQQVNTGFAMLNPKFKIDDQSDSLMLLTYPSDSPDMPETNRIKYLICDELGEELVKGETVVLKNSFVLVPTAQERELLQGNCTMFAQAEQSLASITISRNLTSKAIALEHTQPLQKYVVEAQRRRKTYDLKEYWSDKVVNT